MVQKERAPCGEWLCVENSRGCELMLATLSERRLTSNRKKGMLFPLMPPGFRRSECDDGKLRSAFSDTSECLPPYL